jgi:hypothetical protein
MYSARKVEFMSPAVRAELGMGVADGGADLTAPMLEVRLVRCRDDIVGASKLLVFIRRSVWLPVRLLP